LRCSATAAQELFALAGRPNLFIKIPGTTAGLPAIEEAIFAGVPVNVTLLFSREHYMAAAEAFLRGIERRIDAGLLHAEPGRPSPPIMRKPGSCICGSSSRMIPHAASA